MRFRPRHLWIITTLLFLVTFGPVFLSVAGGILNILWGCDIRDEGGQVHGECEPHQADMVYALQVSLWLGVITVPLIGPLFAIALIASVVWWGIRARREKKEPEIDVGES